MNKKKYSSLDMSFAIATTSVFTIAYIIVFLKLTIF